VTKDLTKIWTEIKKPDALKNLKAEEFFRVDFHTLGHYVYQREKFESDCLELADKLRNKARADFLYKHVEVEKNIPMDGLFMYIQQVWNSIKQNKELNLPS
jgi:protein SEY1